MKKQTIDLTQPENTIYVEEDTEITAIYVGRGEEEIKTKLNIIHQKPNKKSRVKIKAVVFDKAKFDLEGMLKIEEGAKQTDTYLKIDCLVMGESAFARAIPSLEIKESEVKAGHGATIGYLDYDMMYYAKSRGLSQLQAEELLLEAFLNN